VGGILQGVKGEKKVCIAGGGKKVKVVEGGVGKEYEKRGREPRQETAFEKGRSVGGGGLLALRGENKQGGETARIKTKK